jgi:PAS domain S-box-containing protein
MPSPPPDSRKETDAALFRQLVENVTDYAIFILDPEGRVATWNRGAERIKGYKAEEIIGQHFSRFYPREAIERGWPQHELEVARAQGRFEDEGWRLRKDGTGFWANVVITAIRDENGQFRGFSKITRDLTERKLAEESARRLVEEATARRVAEENARLLEQQREQLHVTLCSIGDAVISTDAAGRIDFLNPVAERLLGCKTQEVVHRPLEEVFHIVNESTRQPVDNPALRSLREGCIVGLANHTVLISRDGTERPIDDSAAPIRDHRGEVSGSVLVFRDISERKRTEAALRERMTLLALNAAIGTALAEADGLDAMLQRCAAAMVKHLPAAFARIWTLDPHENVLRLRASAGMYTHLNGPHSRVPVGKYKIGRIAQERKPHLTNNVVGDPQVSDQEWAKREGMVAFAGYPLIVDDRLVGVMMMFARVPLPETTVEAMASVATEIAVGIERKTADERLRQQEEWLRVTLSSIGDAVIATDTEARITFLNQRAGEWTGWPRSEAVGQPLEKVLDIRREDTRQPVESPVARVSKHGSAIDQTDHTVLVSKQGTVRPIDYTAAPIRDSAGAMIGVVLVLRDVTAARTAEYALRQSEARKRAILDTALDAVITMDHDGKVVEFNPAAERIFGYRQADVLGKELAGLIIPPYFREQHKRGMAHYFATGEGPVLGKRLELTAQRADGSKFPIELSVSRTPSDGPPLFTGYLRDISEPRRVVMELRASEQRFRQLADAMPQIVWSARADGNIDYFNRRWTEFTGLPSTVGNEAWGRILHPEDGPAANQRWKASLEKGTPFEMELRLLDQRCDSYRWHLIRTLAIHDDDGKVVRWFGTSTDIHEQKRAEESARFLAEASAALAGVVDYESTLQKVAGLAVPYFADWSAVDIVKEDGTLRRLAVSHQDESKIALAHEMMRDYPPDPQSSTGAYGVLKSGKPEILSDIPDHLLVQGARDERHLRLIRSLGLKSYICVPLIVSGNSLGVLTFATAESGRRYADRDLALAMDLAHRASVAIENTQLYQALREADRRKDEFLATLAHELRNPLAPIRNSLQILKMPRVDAATIERSRDMMERQMHHLVRLVDDLLDVSRVMKGKIDLRRERVEIAAVVSRAVETVQPLADVQGHRLSITLPKESLMVEADPVRLAQVIGNLLTNAVKYTEPGGRIMLTAERSGGEAVVRVRDTGIGIAPEMLQRIFDLFVQVDHTASRSQGGLGIGLTLVKNLVEMHNGTVEARSEGLGKGSEFIVRLPAAASSPVAEAGEGPHTQAKAPASSGFNVLVVDDNQDAANSLAMLLRLQGHEVRVAYSGMAAMEMTKTYRPHLVFLDIGMPGMDGYEVARRLREQPDSSKIIMAAMTGWGQQEDRRRTAEAGFNYHLVKPPDPKAIDGVLAELAASRAKADA